MSLRSLATVLFLAFVLAPSAAAQRSLATGPLKSVQLDYRAADAVFDHGRGHLYVSDLERKAVVQVDLDDGTVTNSWSFPYMAESLAMKPDGTKLYVALLTRNHSPFWFDWQDPHEGYIAEIDLATGTHTRTFWIDEDPGDLVATDSGFLIVASGSGQWDDLRSYDLDTEAHVGTGSISSMCNLTLHPSQTRLYAADTTSAPSDIERFDIDPSTGALISMGDSIYHGDHPMDGDVFIHPNGELLVTRGGGVYTCSSDIGQDMRFLRTLDFGRAEAAVFDVPFQGLLTAGNDSIDYYNLASLETVQEIPVWTGARFLSLAGRTLYVVQVSGPFTYLSALPSPSSFSEGNTAPTADFVTDELPRAGEPIKFEAGGSSDPQDRLTDLVFRWDFTGDGVFDTPFQPDTLTTRAYELGGTKTVTLEVKDSFGLVDRITHDLDVRTSAPQVGPLQPRVPYELQFKAADVLFDPRGVHAYATDLQHKRLVQFDRRTGFHTRSWTFAHPPESLAMPPNGGRLYVALLGTGHQYYGFGAHVGYIAEIDVATGELLRTFEINEDPWDIVVTDSGFLVASSGSGQWDDIRSYDLDTEANVSTSFIRHMSNLELHPSQTRIYAADTDLSPADIERFDINPVTGVLTARGDSPYHGNHPMGDVFAHPNGTLLITSGGGVYNTTVPIQTDMTYVSSLAGGAQPLAFSRNGSLFVRSQHYFGFPFADTQLTVHDAASLLPLVTIDGISGQVEHLSFGHNVILGVTLEDDRSLVHEVHLGAPANIRRN